MRILITNHQYFFLAGTEIFTYTVASALRRMGHEVVIYSPYVGGLISEKTREAEIEIVDQIRSLGDRHFDVIHAQHNVTAVEVRNAFPGAPMVFLSHGVLPFLEQPPVVDLGISVFLAVSEEVRDNLIAKGVPKGKVKVFRNIVDTGRFSPGNPIRKRPKQALIISNTLPEEEKEIIERACGDLGIKTRYIGRVSKPVWEVEKEINKADVVFSLGRGAMEALACGRVVVVYDYNGGDGMVTKENIDEIQKCNFSGRRFKRKYNVTSLKKELKGYDPGLGEEGRELALARFSALRRIDDLVGIYKQAMPVRQPAKLNHDLVAFLSRAVLSTRQTSLWKTVGDQELEKLARHIRGLEKEIREVGEIKGRLEAAIDEIRSSRSWKIVMALKSVKKRLPIVGRL